MLLRDQVAVVTGATRGIGRAAMERLAAEGASVVGVYNSSDKLAEELQSELALRGSDVRMFKGSVTDRSFIASMMKQVYDELGRMDILVNNAGISDDQLALMMSEEQWDTVFRTNFTGTCICCQEAIPYMAAGGGGKVVNVVSVSGVYGREAQVNYAASKGAIIGLTKMLARRYAADGIRLNALAPGMITTQMTDKVPLEKQHNFLRHTNMNRMGTAEEIAGSIVYLASPLSDYVSDHVLKADGGFLR
ncbi:3-oxoacyl-ACP reductase FabG [Paenibacillus eucommiae]|uniref:3-oxoacyl-[acyl-carrier protein] reductase n=1 Tax=Paenibacillus eucommiae TaxID=1355755 RepID=A0ABS4IR34_9BACL|nr:3-oxoacyl-ACP reductase FabG [Paenibacillus eucommiae]MBP1989983.1 3-oxoacyl-[acyl-carrier protein] reductase [Paenibacillus eucommiae]